MGVDGAAAAAFLIFPPGDGEEHRVPGREENRQHDRKIDGGGSTSEEGAKREGLPQRGYTEGSLSPRLGEGFMEVE